MGVEKFKVVSPDSFHDIPAEKDTEVDDKIRRSLEIRQGCPGTHYV